MHVQGKYKVHGLKSANGERETAPTKFYATYDEARKVAETCATNIQNVRSGNSFVIYKAIEVIVPVALPVTVHQVD